MERRKFIGAAGLAGILAAGMAPAVQAGQSIRWRLTSRFPKIQDIPHGGIQTLIRMVREMSGGKFEILLQEADEQTASAGVLDSVQNGNVECGHTSAVYNISKDEVFALDGTIPFGLNARQMTAWMQQGNGLTLLREFYMSYGIINFPMGNTGAQMGGWYRKPVKSLADLKGLRMRITGLGSRVFERIGGKPSNLLSSEIVKAFERGTIDAAEWGGPYDDSKLGLHKVCKNYAYPGWGEGGSQFSLYVNHRAYEALTEENQAILEAATAVAHLDIQAQYDARNPLAMKELLAGKVSLMALPPAVLDAAYKAAQDLYAELSGKSPHWKKIYGSYAAFLRNQSWHWGYGELGFGNYMHERQKKTIAEEQRELSRKKSAPPRRR
jgi:TRAP-type mannitol/chloroaromatic compound transport system substrate-binding protein